MEKEKINTTPGGQQPANLYDDGNLPKEEQEELAVGNRKQPSSTEAAVSYAL